MIIIIIINNNTHNKRISNDEMYKVSIVIKFLSDVKAFFNNLIIGCSNKSKSSLLFHALKNAFWLKLNQFLSPKSY